MGGGFREDLAKAAFGHGGADVGGVTRPIEEMGVDVEGEAGDGRVRRGRLV